MRIAVDGFEGGIRIGGRYVTNLRYADDIVLIATSVEELQILVDRLNTAGKNIGLAINIEKNQNIGHKWAQLQCTH